MEERILSLLNNYPKSNLFFGGDFNVVMDNNIDRWPPKSNNSNSYLKMFMQRFSLVDSWREAHPSLKVFTWNNKSFSCQSRIDLWLASKELNKISTDIIPSPLSDHKSISICIPISTNVNSYSTPSYWKLNNSILAYTEVRIKMDDIITNLWNKANEEDNYCSNWELTKYEVGKYFRKFSSDLAKKRKSNESSVICKIASLLAKNVEDMTDFDKAELTEQQQQLDKIYKYKAEGAYVRSRRKWLEEGEQSSAFFFRLEKQQAKTNTMGKLMIDGVLNEDQKVIGKFCSKFYTDLYTSKFCHQDVTDFFESLQNIQQLNMVDKDFCDAPITTNEIVEAINSLKNGKSPGTDGLTSEFYKLFSKKITPFLLEVFRESIEKTFLPPTLCQGIITLIPKPNKDPLLIDN